MLKKLLYLYNDGHNPFPHMGRGGLGYHLSGVPKVIHGEGGEGGEDEGPGSGGGYKRETDKTLNHITDILDLTYDIITHKSPEVKHGDIDEEILIQKAEDMIEGIDERLKLKPKHKKVIEESIKNEIGRAHV